MACIELVPRSAFADLKPGWDRLWQACPDATPFQSFALVSGWAEAYAPDRTFALVWHDSREIAALVPVFVWQGTLYLAGTGPFDIQDGLFRPDQPVPGDAVQALCRTAQQLSCRTVSLRQLRPGSALLRYAPPEGWRDQCAGGDPCLLVPVAGRRGLDAVPAKRRRKLEYTLRKAALRGGVEVQDVAPEDTAQAIEDLLRLHALRWNERGQAGVLADLMMQRFLRSALPAAAEAGSLRLFRTYVGSQVAALVCGFRAHTEMQFYLTGFDPAFSDLGPGTLALCRAFEAAANEGFARANFLRGEEPYKHALGALPSPMFRRDLVDGGHARTG